MERITAIGVQIKDGEDVFFQLARAINEADKRFIPGYAAAWILSENVFQKIKNLPGLVDPPQAPYGKIFGYPFITIDMNGNTALLVVYERVNVRDKMATIDKRYVVEISEEIENAILASFITFNNKEESMVNFEELDAEELARMARGYAALANGDFDAIDPKWIHRVLSESGYHEDAENEEFCNLLASAPEMAGMLAFFADFMEELMGQCRVTCGEYWYDYKEHAPDCPLAGLWEPWKKKGSDHGTD